MNKIIFILFFITSNFIFGKSSESSRENTDSPMPPGILYVDTTTDTWNAVKFYWGASTTPGVTYKIYYQRKIAGSPLNFVQLGNVLTVTLTANQLVMPMNYNVYVVAVSAGVESNTSNVIFYATPPTTPQNFIVTQLSNTSVKLAWDVSSDDVYGYFVYDNEVIPYFVVGRTNNTFTLPGLVAGSTHSFAVEAMDSRMNSSFTSFDGKTYCIPTGTAASNSAINNVTVGSSTNTTPSGGAFYDDNTQDFSVNDFEIYKNSVKNVMSVTIAPTDSSIGNGSDSNLNTKVYAYIDYNQNGIFEISELVNFGSMSVKPRSINVPLTFVSNPFITPSTSLTGNTTVRIIVQRNNSSSPTINPCAIDGTGEVEDYLMYIGAGWNRMSEPKPTKPSNKATITLSGGKASEVQSIDDTIKLYPNPVLGDIMNITAVNNNTPYRIINMLGQEVGTGKVENGTITVAKLSQGTYSIELVHKDQRIVKRFIKQLK